MALIILLVLLLITAYAPLPWYLLTILLAATFYLSFRHLSDRAAFERRLWLDLYLLPDSDWRIYLTNTTLLRGVAAVTAAFLALVTYLSLYAEHYLKITLIVAMIALAGHLCTATDRRLSENMVRAYAEITRHRLSVTVAAALVLFGLGIADICESWFQDYSQQSARTIADQTIEEIKHPVKIARHWIRTIRYYDLTLLRVRDTLEWPVGWIVYLALLIPSAVPAIGIYSIHRGIKIVLSNWEVA